MLATNSSSWLCEEPTARHSSAQQPGRWHLCENTRQEEWEEKSEKRQYEDQSQKRRWGRRCSRHQCRYSPAACGEDRAGADIHTVAWGAHTGAAGYFLKELELMKSPCRSRVKTWGGKSNRTVVNWLLPTHQLLRGPGREEMEELGVKLILEKERQWEGAILNFVSHYPNLF